MNSGPSREPPPVRTNKKFASTEKGKKYSGITEGIKADRTIPAIAFVEYLDYMHNFSRNHSIETHFDDELRFHDWLWLLLSGYNLLVCGVGNKSKLIQHFVNQSMIGEDVLELDCGGLEVTPDKWMKTCLHTISHDILHEQNTSNNTDLFMNQIDIVIAKLSAHYGSVRCMAPLYAASEQLSLSRGYRQNTVIPTRISSYTMDSNIQTSRKKPRLSASGVSLLPLPVGKAHSDWGGRYSHARSKLYIIVRDIGGPSFSTRQAQAYLAKLAACDSVTLIATMEHVNTPLLWDASILAKFRWVTETVSTYQPQSCRNDFGCIVRDTDFALLASSTEGVQALDYLLASLSLRHHELLSVLSRLILEANMATSSDETAEQQRYGSNQQQYVKSVSFSSLFLRCCAKLFVTKAEDLKVLLKEFIDHKIVSLLEIQNTEHVVLHLPIERLPLLL
jgi:hypothetical protein